MPVVRAQVTIPASSTVSADSVTNTWHFNATNTGDTILDSIQAALITFYEAMDAYKSTAMAWQNAVIKFFDLDEAEPRIPLQDEILGLTASGGTSANVPELAMVLSFRGDYVSGSSQARRRGRIFFGPLNVACVGADGRFSGTAINVLRNAGSQLLVTSDAASDWAWVVWSPTGGVAYPVVAGWVDNSVDIQRRRGMLSTSRLTF